MAASSIIAFWAVAALLIVAPGADWAFTLGATLRGNAVAPAVGGLVTGYAAMTAAVAAGIGALVAGSPTALTAITFTGGAYLVWLGIGTLRNPSSPLADIGAPIHTNRDTYLEGIGVSGLNPKGLLIFVALLPQFTNPQSPWPLAAQMIVLGLTFTLTCAGLLRAPRVIRKSRTARTTRRRTHRQPPVRHRHGHHRHNACRRPAPALTPKCGTRSTSTRR